jgi:hypothetical protein
MDTNKSIYLSNEEAQEIMNMPTADDRYEFMKNYLDVNEQNFKEISSFMECISKVQFKFMSFPEMLPHIMDIAMMDYPVAYNELIISMKKYMEVYDDNQF